MGTLPHQDRMIFPSFKNHKRSDPLIDPPRVLWGRGWPYACTYCSVPSLRKVFREPLRASKTSWVRFPPAEKAIEEIEILRDTWIFDKYIIDDDDIVVNSNGKIMGNNITVIKEINKIDLL